MEERQYLIALYTFLPFGPQRINLLHSYFNSYKNVWNAGKDDLLEIGLKQATVERFISHRKKFPFNSYFQNLQKC